jgi:hypothetical protein
MLVRPEIDYSGPYSGKSCAKILQVNVFQKDNPSETHKMYAIIDDQSNRSLASPAFFDMFNILTTNPLPRLPDVAIIPEQVESG